MVLIFLGIVFLCVGGIVSIRGKKKKKSCTHRVTAAILDVRKKETVWLDYRKTVSWYPVYAFYVKGHSVTKQGNCGSRKPRYKEGDLVDIYINPDDPQMFYDPKEKRPMAGAVFTAAGVVLSVCGIYGEVFMHSLAGTIM